MTVHEIIKQYLETHGYDGLFCAGECSCRGDDMCPCSENPLDCEPGYLRRALPEEESIGEWVIGDRKPVQEIEP